MPTTVILAFAAAAVMLIGLTIWYRRTHRHGDGSLPLYIEGFALIRFSEKQLSESQARRIGVQLQAIYVAVLVELGRVYGVEAGCVINSLTLDTGYYKPAEWTGIAARTLTVNPIKPKHRSHFAEEIHNLYRFERFGVQHVYDPVDETDAAFREEMQGFCRNI